MTCSIVFANPSSSFFFRFTELMFPHRLSQQLFCFSLSWCWWRLVLLHFPRRQSSSRFWKQSAELCLAGHFLSLPLSVPSNQCRMIPHLPIYPELSSLLQHILHMTYQL
uniref:Uncharacterized protein n=1 Tax=Lotus japonicus TaxID=34305 RepID=I3SCE3_LOTJA|nr:unknown [Lotus japonicus]